MENQTEQSQQWKPVYEHPTLSSEIISEYDLSLLLGVSHSTLNYLRLNNSLPYIPMNKTNRVYNISQVKEWLNNRRTIAVKKSKKSDTEK